MDLIRDLCSANEIEHDDSQFRNAKFHLKRREIKINEAGRIQNIESE